MRQHPPRARNHPMRRCCLAVSSVLILHQGFSFAQHLDSSRKLDSEPPPGWDLPNKLPADDDKERGGKTFGFWASGEYLLWWTKNGRIPPWSHRAATAWWAQGRARLG